MDSQGFIAQDIRFEGALFETTKTCSVSTGFLFKNFLKSTVSFSMVSFNANPKAVTSWYGETPFFDGQKLSCFSGETFFSIPFFKTKISAAVCETPFNDLRFWTRNESLFSAGAFSLYSTFFVRDDIFSSSKTNLLTPDNSFEKYFFQGKITPSFSFLTKKLSLLETGIGASYGESLESQGLEPELQEKISFSFGVKYLAKSFSLNTVFSANEIDLQKIRKNEETFPSYSSAISLSKSFGKKLSTSIRISGNLKFKPDSVESKNKFEETFRFSLSRKNKILNTISLSASGTQQKASNKWTFGARTGFKIPCRKIRLNGYFSFYFDFQAQE